MIVRSLVLSNMRAGAGHPERGRFVRDQVDALRRLDGTEIELLEFEPGARALTSATTAQMRRRRGGPPKLDVVHAHFGLTAWAALATPARVRAVTLHGTDLSHPRTRALTLAALARIDLVATVSEPLRASLPPGVRERTLVLPCGVDHERFRPQSRERARAELGLDRDGSYLLFPADPHRPEKRYALARSLADAVGAHLLTLGGVPPERVPVMVNASQAVLVTSEREGFGLGVLEALACNIPVLATPVGIHAEVLRGVPGTLCAPFDLAGWRAALTPHLEADDPHVDGRDATARFSTIAMARRVLAAWTTALTGRRDEAG